MGQNEQNTSISNQFLESVSAVLTQARKAAKTAVNLSMVYAYFEIGRMIIEEEQHGQDRAAYGKQVLKALSDYLTKIHGKGFSPENLKLMRRFYTVYSHDQIGETVFTQFENLPAVSTGRKFFLSWSHYLKLMRISNVSRVIPALLTRMSTVPNSATTSFTNCSAALKSAASLWNPFALMP